MQACSLQTWSKNPKNYPKAGNGVEKREKHFPSPTWKMGAKTQNGGPQLLILYWRAREIHMVKDNGFAWLRWLTRRGHHPKSYPITPTSHANHRNNKCALELPFLYILPIQGSW
jgi:hypothetical protein